MVNESDLDDLASLLTGTPKGNSVLTLDKLLSWPSGMESFLKIKLANALFLCLWLECS